MSDASSLVILLDNLISQMDILINLSDLEKDALEKNDASLIQQNNIQRSLVQKDIAQLIEELMDTPALTATRDEGSLLERILAYAASLEQHPSTELMTSAQKLKDSVITYMNKISVNRLILNTNLHRIKEFFNILTHNKNLLDVSLYNQSGLIKGLY